MGIGKQSAVFRLSSTTVVEIHSRYLHGRSLWLVAVGRPPAHRLIQKVSIHGAGAVECMATNSLNLENGICSWFREQQFRGVVFIQRDLRQDRTMQLSQ